MITIKCKICGGDVQLSNDKTFGVCEYCGSSITMPKIDDEQRAAAFDRGNHFRRIGEFDKALAVYERIVNEDNSDAEAHWCCALCRFGIEYVEDPATYEWLPTCHRASFDNFLEDVDYLASVECSDSITRRQYQKDAAKIAEVQRRILATSQKEEPFDVFICYKESDENGQRTVDSTLAQDIYYQLTDKGRRVFFARITLENKGGAEYEPYIFAALNSAKVMVVVGTSAENFNAVWVKNEWSRFLSLLKKDHTKLLLPCYRDMDPYDLPDQLSVLQSYDMSKIGFVQDLIRGIDKVLDADKVQEIKQETVILQSEGNANVIALVKRGNMALEDNDWNMADNFFDRVLDMDAECAEAYLGKALSEFKASSLNELLEILLPDTEQLKPKEAKAQINGHEEREDKLITDNQVLGYLSCDELRKIISFNYVYLVFEDSYKEQMEKNLQELSNNKNFVRAERYARDGKKIEIADFKEALKKKMNQGLCIIRDKDIKAEEGVCEAYEQSFTKWERKVVNMRIAAETRRNNNYKSAIECFENGEYELALTAFQSDGLAEYLDSADYIEKCKERMDAKETQLQIEAKAKEGKRKRLILFAVGAVIVVAAVAIIIGFMIPKRNYSKAEKLLEDGKYEEAVNVFESLGEYGNSSERILDCYYQQAVELINNGEYEKVAELLDDVSDYQDVDELFLECYYELAEAYLDDGLYVEAARLFGQAGDYSDAPQRFREVWNIISGKSIAISAGSKHTVGLKSDGTVVAIGNNDYGQCEVEDWTDIIEVAAGQYHTVGLKEDGTVVFAGQCTVAGWDDIIAISAGSDFTVGLKLDGSVVAVGDNDYGQCEVTDWTDIIAIAAGSNHTVGLKSDGTVVAVGNGFSGQCDVEDWTDIIAISAGETYTLGLKSDGTAVATKHNAFNDRDVDNWTDVIAISAGSNHAIGLKSDGTVVAGGTYSNKACDVSNWTDIVAISAGLNYTIGIKLDGTVVAVGNNDYGQCDVSDWTDIKVD